MNTAFSAFGITYAFYRLDAPIEAWIFLFVLALFDVVYGAFKS